MSAEADAVASMLQLATKATGGHEQSTQDDQNVVLVQEQEEDVEMENPTESSLSDLEDRAGSEDEEVDEGGTSEIEGVEDEDEDDDGEVDSRADAEHGDGIQDDVEEIADEGEDTEAETERLHESPDKARGSRNVHHRAEDQLQLPEDNIDQTSEISALSDSGDMTPLDSPVSSPRKRKRDEFESEDEEEGVARSLRDVTRKLEAREENGEEEPEGVEAENGLPDLEDDKDAGEDGSADERDSSKENTPDREGSPRAGGKADTGTRPTEDGVADEAEAEVELEAKGEEDNSLKETALSSLRFVEKDFARLRDRRFAERTQQLNHELELLHHNPTTHPEYAAAMEAIDRRTEDQVRQARVTLDYKIGSLQKKSVAERTMAHSQYVQDVQRIRDKCLEAAGEEWYRIQKARRQGDDDEFEKRYHYVADRTNQVARQMAYNQEVSILSGVQKYVGFPAAPSIEGVTQSEVEEDLKKMGISNKPKHSAPYAAKLSSFPRTVNPVSADEHFLKANPWADASNALQMHAQMIAAPQTFNTPAIAQRPDAPQGSASTIAAVSSVEQTPMSNPRPIGGGFSMQMDGASETPSRIPGPSGLPNGTMNNGVSGSTPQSNSLAVPPAKIPVPAAGS